MSADNLLARAVAEAQEAERTKAHSPNMDTTWTLFACAMVAGGIASSHGLVPDDIADRSIAIVDALWSRLLQRQAPAGMATSSSVAGPAAEAADPALV